MKEENLTLGQKISDKLASFAGSWTFIIIFFFVLIFWMWLNSTKIFSTEFDPFPFILLNLVLSCLAAIQAPVILMSQNRQGERDRHVLESDYEVDVQSRNKIEQLFEEMKNLNIKIENIYLEIHKFQHMPSQKKSRAKKCPKND